MTDIKERVSRCFRSVLPDLPPDQVAQANMASTAGWDSVAHVTLLSAVSEEFGLDFELEDYEHLVSYPLIVAYLENKTGS